MKAIDYREVPLRDVNMEGAKGVKMRWLISQVEAPNFAMRMFEVEPQGHTPLHVHPSEHEIFIIEGSGEVTLGDDVKPLGPGVVAYVPPDLRHQFRNTGGTLLRFLCLIPKEK